MSRVIAQVVLAALLLAPVIAAAGPNPAELHKKARARMKSLDFEAALPLLEQLRELPSLDKAVKGQVLVDLGITFAPPRCRTRRSARWTKRPTYW